MELYEFRTALASLFDGLGSVLAAGCSSTEQNAGVVAYLASFDLCLANSVRTPVLVRPGLQVIMPSWVGIDGRGWPAVRKAVLEQDLAHAMKQTTGLCQGRGCVYPRR